MGADGASHGTEKTVTPKSSARIGFAARSMKRQFLSQFRQTRQKGQQSANVST
jgi:hypothetical protein